MARGSAACCVHHWQIKSSSNSGLKSAQISATSFISSPPHAHLAGGKRPGYVFQQVVQAHPSLRNVGTILFQLSLAVSCASASQMPSKSSSDLIESTDNSRRPSNVKIVRRPSGHTRLPRICLSEGMTVYSLLMPSRLIASSISCIEENRCDFCVSRAQNQRNGRCAPVAASTVEMVRDAPLPRPPFTIL